MPRVVRRLADSNIYQRIKMKQAAAEWRWSSHRETIKKSQGSLLDEIPITLPQRNGENM